MGTGVGVSAFPSVVNELTPSHPPMTRNGSAAMMDMGLGERHGSRAKTTNTTIWMDTSSQPTIRRFTVMTLLENDKGPGLLRGPCVSHAREANRRGGKPRRNNCDAKGDLDVVVQLELVRVRPQANRIHLVRALVIDPGFDQIGGENPSCLQVLVVRFEGIEDRGQ